MPTGSRLRVSVSAVVMAMTMSIAVAATTATVAATTTTATAVPAAAVTPSAPHTLYVSVANRYLTMPHRITAGQYFFQVRTSDPHSVVQMVRPPAGYTPRQFLAAGTLWSSRYNSGADSRAAYTAFVKSVTFVGGASVARGGVGAFATGLGAGTYWLYEATYEVPTHLARIVVLTVVGTPPAQTTVSPVGVVRFSAAGAVTLPANLPVAGWLKGIGGAPLNSLWTTKLAPGVTKADLDTPGVCDADIVNPTKDCYQPGGVRLGGHVSAGASVFWYYRMPPGDYTAGSMGPSALFDRPYLFGSYTRFTVS
ncbi:MAG: hypothetical protein ABIP19_13165 [Dermatophilaceae bacterium]